MLIGLDVDGVLADFVGHTITTLVRDGFDIHTDLAHYDVWDVCSRLPPSAASHARGMWRCEVGWCASMPLLDGARAFVDALRQHHEVIFVTTPYPQSATWMRERRDWLIEHFDTDESDILFVPHKHKPRVMVDRLLDDNADTVWRTGHGVLFETPHNVRDRERALHPPSANYETFLFFTDTASRCFRGGSLKPF